MTYFDRLMDDTIDCLRRATAQHDTVIGQAIPEGTQHDLQAVDRAWNGMHAAQPTLRAIEDEAIRALDSVYDVHHNYDEVRKAIESAEAEWVYDAIFTRAAETAVQHGEDRA